MNKKTHFGFKDVDIKDKEEHVGNVFTSVATNYAVSYTHLTLPTKRIV